MRSGIALLLYLALQRATELAVARRNTARLLDEGAYEASGDAYPQIVAMHAAWLGTLAFFGRKQSLRPFWCALFIVLQVARYWVLATLGRRWTTKVLIVPGESPVTAGPYRFVRHPNYLVVACELPCASLALGLPWHALAFGTLNLAVLRRRIRCEDAAFAENVAKRVPPPSPA